MKKYLERIALVAMTCAFVAAIATLFACSSGGTLAGEDIAETGGYKVTATNASADAAVVVSGAVTLEEGDVLAVSPDLTKGKLQVKLTDAAGSVAFEEELSGRVMDTYELAPGAYDIAVTCTESGTTGTLLITGENAGEVEKQNQALDAALAASAGSAAAAQVADSSYEVDYGKSDIYGKDDIDGAIRTVMAEFGTWKGCKMNKIAFADDETCEANVEYCNSLRDADEPEFDQAIVLVSSFHSPSAEEAKGTAWEPDKDYDDYSWTLGRTDNGEWKLMTWGYN